MVEDRKNIEDMAVGRFVNAMDKKLKISNHMCEYYSIEVNSQYSKSDCGMDKNLLEAFNKNRLTLSRNNSKNTVDFCLKSDEKQDPDILNLLKQIQTKRDMVRQDNPSMSDIRSQDTPSMSDVRIQANERDISLNFA